MIGKNNVVMGIDCGETATHIRIANAEGSVIAERKSDAIWEQHIDETALAAEINRLVMDSCEESGCGFDRVASIVVVIPGINRTADENPVVKGLMSKWKRRKKKPDFISVITAPILALETFYPRQPAVFASADDSAFVAARNSSNAFIHAGGWGAAIPASGSADAIVKKVLRYISEVYDERAINSPFFKTITGQLSIDSPSRFHKALYNDTLEKNVLIAATCKAAEERDLAASSILDSAADEIVDMIRHIATRLPMSKRIPILLHGRLFEADKIYTAIVRRKLSAILPQLAVSSNKFSGAECAVHYAIYIAGNTMKTKKR